MRIGLSVALTLVASCGYGQVGRGSRAIAVAKVVEHGIDIDAAAMVGVAVRHAVARAPGTTLAPVSSADHLLEVELVDAATALEPFAEPGLRAAQYRVTVVLRGIVRAPNGDLVWRTPPVRGEAPFLSTPGAIEALDGARRRSLERAAEEAADRLVTLLSLYLDAG